MMHRTIIAALALALCHPALAADIYVRPPDARSEAQGDGSRERPFANIAKALEEAKGGDEILLLDGDYPPVSIGSAFASQVTIRSANGRNARIEAVNFQDSAKHIRLANLSLWRNEGADGGYIVRSMKGATRITLEGNDIRAREDSINYLSWPQARWAGIASNAVDLRGKHNVVRGNSITGVGRAINAGEHSLVEGNIIDGFTQDGLRGTSNSIFRNNLVKNALKVDDTHRDGFQSYSKGTVTGLSVEGNVIIAWTHPVNSPLRGDMQGIGLFDGFYDDLVIKDNIIATNHYHGITVRGTRRAVITGNIVVNLDGEVGKAPWIKVGSRKNGEPSENVIVSGNAAMSLDGANAVHNVVFSRNTVIKNPTRVLKQSGALTFRPGR